MKNFKKNVPSLTAMVALEAAARHQSFTLAAQELGVTQAAVSRQIGALEQDLGTRLFLRGHRSVEPTPSCLILVATLSKSFSEIMHSVDSIRTVSRDEVVTIGTSTAFATLWLIPRLTELHQCFPSIQIRLVSQDSRRNLNMAEVDVAVWFGTLSAENGKMLRSRPDSIFPVCSPAVAARFGTAEQFFRAPSGLIEHDTSNREWNSWKQWFAHACPGVKIPAANMRFNHYADALEAAKAGQGIVLGWNVLVQRYLRDGSLVVLGDRAVTPDGCYSVIIPLRDKPSELSERVASWIVDNL